MYLVHADDIQLTAGTKILLSHVSFSLQPKEKIGLVGKNGTGKSTLLKTISQQKRPRKGEIDVQTSPYYVPQEIELSPRDKEKLVISYLLEQHEEGWNVFYLIEKLFDYHAITAEKQLGHLSGGELKMLFLALALLIEPELLLLDEPTNHLDTVATTALIKAIKEYRHAVVVISHDSYFLDETVQRIFEIRDQKLHKFTGNYSSFVLQKRHEREVLIRKARVHEKEIASSKARKQQVSERIMRREADEKKYASKGVPKIMRGFFIDKAGRSTTNDMAKAKQAEQAQKAELQEIREQLKKTQTLNIELGTADTQVYSLVDIEQATVVADTVKIVENITLRVTNEDTILLKGRNGSGKSSLLKAIHQSSQYQLQSLHKPILPKRSLYIDQHYSLIDPDKTVMTHIAQEAPTHDYEELRKVLGNFLFTTDLQVNALAQTLSGGEKARLAIAMASVSPRTLLLLDEPTNNLDTESVDELILALQTYVGGVIIVSHDLGFIKSIAWTQQIELP